MTGWKATDVKGHKMWENSEGERSLDPFPDDRGVARYNQYSSPIYIHSNVWIAFAIGVFIGAIIGIVATGLFVG